MPDTQKVIDTLADGVKDRIRPVRDAVTERVPALAPYLTREVAMRPLRRQRDYWTDPITARLARPHAQATTDAVLKSFNVTIQKSDPILEIGSGVGDTLAALAEAGYTNLTGVELNPHAVAEMHRRHPNLDAKVFVGPAEVVLSGLPDDTFKMIIAVRTLQHVHPDARDLFATIGRLGSTLVTIDEPPVLSSFRYPWDIAAELSEQGFHVADRKPVQDQGRPTNLTVLQLRRIESLGTLHKFWTQPAPVGNVPATYVGPVARSAALRALIDDLPRDSKVLEVGCNVGRNLAYLHDHDFPDVQGIEINPHAVELLRKTYPQLADCTIHLGPAGEMLAGFADDSLDLIFTMAVLEHLHPDEARHVFDAMARISANVLNIEPMNHLSHRQYPHDVVAEMEARGMTLVSSTPIKDLTDDPGLSTFTAYRFARAT